MHVHPGHTVWTLPCTYPQHQTPRGPLGGESCRVNPTAHGDCSPVPLTAEGAQAQRRPNCQGYRLGSESQQSGPSARQSCLRNLDSRRASSCSLQGYLWPCVPEGLGPSFLQERLRAARISGKFSAPEGTGKSWPPRPWRLLGAWWALLTLDLLELTPPSSRTGEHTATAWGPPTVSWTGKEVK